MSITPFLALYIWFIILFIIAVTVIGCIIHIIARIPHAYAYAQVQQVQAQIQEPQHGHGHEHRNGHGTPTKSMLTSAQLQAPITNSSSAAGSGSGFGSAECVCSCICPSVKTFSPSCSGMSMILISLLPLFSIIIAIWIGINWDIWSLMYMRLRMICWSHYSDMLSLYSLYISSGGSILHFLLWLAIISQPVLMAACQSYPHTMDTLLSNSHTSSYSSNVGTPQLHYQTLCLIAYHTSSLSRLLHVVTIYCDAAAYLTIVAHVIQSIQSDILYTISWMIIIGIILGQAYSYAGIQLVMGVSIAWCLVYMISSTLMGLVMLVFDTTTIIPRNSSTDIRYWVSFRLSAIWLLSSCCLRVLGHSADIGRSVVIGNQSFLGIRSRSRSPSTSCTCTCTCTCGVICIITHLIRNRMWNSDDVYDVIIRLIHNCIKVPIVILFSVGAEFNAGMPFRLFPVFIHFIMLRYNLYSTITTKTTPTTPVTPTPTATDTATTKTTATAMKSLPPSSLSESISALMSKPRSSISCDDDGNDADAECQLQCSSGSGCGSSAMFGSTSTSYSTDNIVVRSSDGRCTLFINTIDGIISYTMDDMIVNINHEIMSLQEINVWAAIAVTHGWKVLACCASFLLSSLSNLSSLCDCSSNSSLCVSASRFAFSRSMIGLFRHSCADFTLDHMKWAYCEDNYSVLPFHSHQADLFGLWPHLPSQVLECNPAVSLVARTPTPTPGQRPHSHPTIPPSFMPFEFQLDKTLSTSHVHVHALTRQRSQTQKHVKASIRQRSQSMIVTSRSVQQLPTISTAITRHHQRQVLTPSRIQCH